MPVDDPLSHGAHAVDNVFTHGAHVASVCNACRYCEQFCPVFPAIEQRLVFEKKDLVYLANLCHNCGECLYACQFAPPHEFGINVPMVLAEARTQSYEAYAWPFVLGRAFASSAFRTTLAALTIVVSMLVLVSLASPEALWSSDGSANFYGVIPHAAMVTLFGAVSLFVLIVMTISGSRFWRDLRRRHVPRRAGPSGPAALSYRILTCSTFFSPSPMTMRIDDASSPSRTSRSDQMPGSGSTSVVRR